MSVVNFTETQRNLEINGVIYPIAHRTAQLEERLAKEHDDIRETLTEYQRYKVLISLLLGEEAFAELFPLGEGDSLDKMAQVAWYAIREYQADYNKLEREKLKGTIKDAGIEEITSTLSNVNKQIDGILSKAERAKHMKK